MYGYGRAYGRPQPVPSGGTPTPTPSSGPVRSASIDPSGNLLSLVLSGVAAGGWSDYPLSGDQTTGVTLSTTTAGFDREGGQALPNPARARTLKGLRPRRRTPIAPSSDVQPNANILDETDNGDGTRTVQLWLSRHVYSGDTATLSLAAGWRTGTPAQTVPVTNGSTLAAAPVSGGRWLTPPLQRVTGGFRVDCMGGSVNPEGLSGLAAVRFDVTDGVTTKTMWGTLSTSTAYADSVRCWGATIDPTGLNAGLITVHKTLYPWVGPSRTSGSAQASAAGSFSNTADAPLVFAYDPAGTRYPAAWVMCDPVGGTLTASAAMVQPTLAAAKAVASKPASISTAIQAIYLTNRSAAAANGGAALARMADDARIVVPAGVTPISGSAITAGLTSTECWPIVTGDPDDPNPRANCVVAAPATALNWRMTHLAYRQLTLRLGAAVVAPVQSWLHDVQVEAASGSEATGAFLSINAASWCHATSSTIGSSLTVASFAQGGVANRFALVRSCTTPRAITALAIVGCTAREYAGWANIGDADSQADWTCVSNAMLATTTQKITFPAVTSGGYRQMVRPLLLNLLMERVGTDGMPFWQQGENQTERFTHAVIEGVSAIGQRCNTLYNDPPDLTSRNVHVDCRVANGYFDWLPTKHDDFRDDIAANQGAPNFGYRPWLTEDLWFQSGVNCEGNVQGRRVGAGEFQQSGFGRNGVVNPSASTSQGNAWTRFTADRSTLGSGAGGGDYRPTAGSPLIGVGVSANLDADRLGVLRAIGFAAGAHEPA